MEETLMTWEEFVVFALSQGWQKMDKYSVARKMRDNGDELIVTIESSRELTFNRSEFDDYFSFNCKTYEKALAAANGIVVSLGEWIDEKIEEYEV